LPKISAIAESHHKSLLPTILFILDRCIKRICRLFL